MSTAIRRPTPPPEPATTAPPALENGDRLARPEFERRYDAMPDVKKAELIDGVVYMPSPVRVTRHGQPRAHIVTWLGVYESRTPGVRLADNASVRLDWDNMPQPDAALLLDPAAGGQARIDEDDYIAGAPELIVEVAASSVSYDLHDKLDLYRRHNVREYLVWRVLDRALDWLALREGRYEPLSADESGRLRSEVFPGLWLDPAALLRGELAWVLEVLNAGLQSPDHAAIRERGAGHAP